MAIDYPDPTVTNPFTDGNGQKWYHNGEYWHRAKPVDVEVQTLNISNIPTATTGVSGDVWSDAGTLKIVP